MRIVSSLLAVSAILLVGCSPSRDTSETRATVTPASLVVVASSAVSTIMPTEVSKPSPSIVPTGIPEPSPTVMPIETPKPQVKLDVLGFTDYRDSSNAIRIVGAIVNKGSVAAESIQVAVTLLDDQGKVLATSSNNYAAILVALPGTNYPFNILISQDKAPKEWKEVKIQVQGQPYNPSSTFFAYLDLKVENISGKAPTSRYNGYSFAGQVKNTGTKAVESVTIAMIAYGDDGSVLDVASARSKLNQIPAGGDAPFELCH